MRLALLAAAIASQSMYTALSMKIYGFESVAIEHYKNIEDAEVLSLTC